MSKSHRLYGLRLERARSGAGVLLLDAAGTPLGASVFVAKPIAFKPALRVKKGGGR